MNNSAAKVGEIFTEAGAAFNRLADMTMLLHPINEQQPGGSTKSGVKRKIMAEDRYTASSAPIQQTPVQVQPPPLQQIQHNIHTAPISQQVTLNMLNAHHESEMDGDDLGNDVKLEFESSTEEVTT